MLSGPYLFHIYRVNQDLYNRCFLMKYGHFE